ncbi:serine protease Do [Malonomonas rubra DSM 5091]|uniref:Probable periplasmic serine endoprotease DegP-like n=1 Tax=Malonomonas rubra DSM 5091 TaxID=1122189 RepID=A0A1M6IXL6_MALRU|nr:DegQ family serine endoprotease [Malonomonas rubra]SHJ39151.1 serine protease Do [Malonomonas rubra DSM 5091]
MKLSKLLLLFFASLLLVTAGGTTLLAQDEGISALRESGKAFRSVAKQVSPAVVYIQVEKEVEQQQMNNPFGNSPFGDEFFRRFFGQPSPKQNPHGQTKKRQSMGQGSGFIISADGYIMTNNHVVGDADKVTVQLLDGREFTAKTIGTDPPTDVALIKIEADEKLPFIPLGDSDKMEVGDWVLAFGNPFGLSHTLTAGIVSAKGRSGIGLTDYENFIQTDAAINPGNSGGPLVNLDGEAIGMNTAIFSRSGGYMGIGFAIPINMVKNIREQLVEHGSVTRGRLGVYIQDIDQDLADSFDLEQTDGILVAQVIEDSPAEKAGLEQGDVILKLNGETVNKVAKFRNTIALTRPGTDVKLLILRDGKKKTVKVTIGSLETDEKGQPVSADKLPKLGMSLQKLTDDLAEQFGYEGAKGVLVTAVEADSIAARAGIKRGDLIEEVNRKPVSEAHQVKKLIKESEKKTVLLLVRQGDASRYLALKLSD